MLALTAVALLQIPGPSDHHALLSPILFLARRWVFCCFDYITRLGWGSAFLTAARPL